MQAADPPSFSKPVVSLTAAVSVDYERGKSLRAWGATAQAIQASLAEWQSGQTLTGIIVTNPSPMELQKLLRSLPDAAATDRFQVVYFGARHTVTGDWEFTRQDDGERAWDALLPAARGLQPGRVVILDICHAGTVCAQPTWRERLAPAATLLASDRKEWTYELDFNCRQPVDLSSRYPAAAAWLRGHLPSDRDGRMSNLGVVWVLADLQTPQVPHNLRDWQDFFAHCEHEGAQLRELLPPDRISFIRQDPPRP